GRETGMFTDFYITGGFLLRDSDADLTLNQWKCTGASGAYDHTTETVTGCEIVNANNVAKPGTLTQNSQTDTWSATFTPPLPPPGPYTVTVKSTQTTGGITSTSFPCTPMPMSSSVAEKPRLAIDLIVGKLRDSRHRKDSQLTVDDFIFT